MNIEDQNPSAANLNPIQERDQAVHEFATSLDDMVEQPLTVSVPGYSDGDFGTKHNPLVHRIEGWSAWEGHRGVEFNTQADGDGGDALPLKSLRVEAPQQDEAGELRPSPSDRLIQNLTGKKVEGYVTDFRTSSIDPTSRLASARYALVSGEDGTQDVLKLPGRLATTEHEKQVYDYALHQIENPDQERAKEIGGRQVETLASEYADWLTPDHLQKMFGGKIKAASTEEIVAVTAKLKDLAGGYTERKQDHDRREENSRNEYEQYRKLRNRVTRFVGRLTTRRS
jgi:hypothetical protein